MKLTFLLLLCLCVCAGCATQVGETSFPKPSANFSPKRTYPVAYAVAWEKVMLTLDQARIGVASENKTEASGRIQTDYIAGSQSLIAGGFVASQSTRYHYSISLRPDGANTTVNVVCKVGSTMKGGSGASPWTDVSGQNSQLIAQLETWLYEQIEKNL
jgi:hypothetical protein